ncbi:MAG TPA: MmgE/PrpD family protein [Solirubrobacterales bacterium]|nr:MmgE/PrpD family protein [Solirubrobacterales bacterium]
MTVAADATVARTLGEFAAGMAAAEPPAAVLEKLRCNVLHDLGCAAAAHSEWPALAPLARADGAAEATVLCAGVRLGAERAAFLNAALMHARAQDDTHMAARTHAGSAVLPAAFAVAEREGRDGAAFAAAALAGYEVATAVGERLAAATTARGFRASMVFGTLGAAAAAASLLGLDAGGCANAIAIAGSFSGGLNQAWIDGSSEWRWELGMAARNGIAAADLAAAGAVGARHFYEGDAGFARAFAGAEDAAAGDWEMGGRWRILEIVYKPFPICNITQSPVAAAIELVEENDLAPAAVTAIRCWLNPGDHAYPGTLNAGPFDGVGAALMSAQYCLAMAVKDRDATLGGLREGDDPELLGLVGRTTILADEAIAPLGARVELTTADGAVHVRELVAEPETYGWTWEGVVENSRRMLGEMAIDADGLRRLTDAVARLERLPSPTELVAGTVA